VILSLITAARESFGFAATQRAPPLSGSTYRSPVGEVVVVVVVVGRVVVVVVVVGRVVVVVVVGRVVVVVGRVVVVVVLVLVGPPPQLTPLTVNDVGVGLASLQVPLKPM